MAAVKRDYKAHDVLYLVEQFQLKNLHDDYEEIDATRDMWARKYMRSMIRDNNKVIGQIVQEYCEAKGYTNTDKYYREVYAAFAETFLQCSATLREEYIKIRDDAKLVNVLDLYGMYCFNEFQKIFIRDAMSIVNKGNIGSLKGLINHTFQKYFLDKDNAKSRKPTNPKYPFDPIYVERSYIRKGQGLYFNSNLIKLVPDQNLYGATLICKTPKVEKHVQRFIRAEIAMLYNRTVETNSKNYIKPHQIWCNFNWNDWNSQHQAALAESQSDNPYFASSDNHRTGGRQAVFTKQLNDMEDFDEMDPDPTPTDLYTEDLHPLYRRGNDFVYSNGTPYGGRLYQRIDDTMDFVPIDDGRDDVEEEIIKEDEVVDVHTNDDVKEPEEYGNPKIKYTDDGYLMFNGIVLKENHGETFANSDGQVLTQYYGYNEDGEEIEIYVHPGTLIQGSATQIVTTNENGEIEYMPIGYEEVDEEQKDVVDYDDEYPYNGRY